MSVIDRIEEGEGGKHTSFSKNYTKINLQSPFGVNC